MVDALMGFNLSLNFAGYGIRVTADERNQQLLSEARNIVSL